MQVDLTTTRNQRFNFSCEKLKEISCVNGIFRAKADNVVSMHTFHGGNGPGGKCPGGEVTDI